MLSHEVLLQEAESFITACYRELNKQTEELEKRLAEVKQEIEVYGSYKHTFEELEHGARMAWRNNNRCIGRLFWNMLKVFDARSLQTEEAIYKALLDHLAFATNDGKIRPAITIFKPHVNEQNKIRIWNHQLLRYAGYETEHGIIGDPDSVSFTRTCVELGWKGQGTQFDILPLVIQLNDNPPVWFDIPGDSILEVPLTHPEYDWFEDLQMKWYSVPVISDMRLEIGGIHYDAAPFNGWYMGTEIGARNLADSNRYNVLPRVASLMDLNITRNTTLWKDKALVELNIAVLHSFKEAGVSIVDHHTAAQQFQLFELQEREQGRKLTGNWTWLIPPLSPATTHIFHKPYHNELVKPNYFYQTKPYPIGNC